MKILLASHFFSPSIGGIETSSLALAREFRRSGHEVRIVTQSLTADLSKDHGFVVLRKPHWQELIQAIHWCDVYYQNNVSILSAWALIFIRKPWFVTTQTWLGPNRNALRFTGTIKRLLLRFANNMYIGNAIAQHIGHPGPIVGNPYDRETFRQYPDVNRNQDIVFLGRLVPDKGCDLLIDAVKKLRMNRPLLTVTIIGDGTERHKLEEQANDAGLQSMVRFVGKMTGESLAKELNRHRVIAIPSSWEEPFGIVALEGMASGCIPVVSSSGGLPDAIGGHGFVFAKGDVNALVDALDLALNASTGNHDFSSHLSNFTPSTVAQKYLDEFRKALAFR